MRHLIAALVYVAAFTIVMRTGVQGDDSVALPLAIAASVMAGVISGSWWSPLLATFLVVLAALDECEPAERCEVNLAVLALMFWAPVSGALIALGVGVRRVSQGARR